MKDFYITLLSDSSMNMFPSNKQSQFTVRLDHPIKIDVESWEVDLVEIATPSEVLNITEENNYFFLTFLDQSSLRRVGNQNITEICSSENSWYNFKLTIPTGNYHGGDSIDTTCADSAVVRDVTAYIAVVRVFRFPSEYYGCRYTNSTHVKPARDCI